MGVSKTHYLSGNRCNLGGFFVLKTHEPSVYTIPVQAYMYMYITVSSAYTWISMLYTCYIYRGIYMLSNLLHSSHMVPSSFT